MSTEQLLYWGAFGIPLILFGMTGFIRKVVDGGDFKREHWYLGIDLKVYFLASTLVNVLDIAKGPEPDGRKQAVTVLFGALAVVLLLVQVGLHQSWGPGKPRSRMQVWMLCGFCNLLGILPLWAFVIQDGGIDMKTQSENPVTPQAVRHLVKQLGGRTLAGMATAMTAAILLLVTPELGIAGAAAAIVFGGVSAVLIHPHSNVKV